MTGDELRSRIPLTVRLERLSGAERMHRAHEFKLEAGYERARNGKEKGGMVAVYFTGEDNLPQALEALAEVWAKHRRACVDEADRGRVIVPTFGGVSP